MGKLLKKENKSEKKIKKTKKVPKYKGMIGKEPLVIAEGSSTGSVSSAESEVIVVGTVNGDATSKIAAMIEPGSKVTGKVSAPSVEAHGTILGGIDAVILKITENAVINGPIRTSSVSIESGAVINGDVSMGKWSSAIPSDSQFSSYNDDESVNERILDGNPVQWNDYPTKTNKEDAKTQPIVKETKDVKSEDTPQNTADCTELTNENIHIDDIKDIDNNSLNENDEPDIDVFEELKVTRFSTFMEKSQDILDDSPAKESHQNSEIKDTLNNQDTVSETTTTKNGQTITVVEPVAHQNNNAPKDIKNIDLKQAEMPVERVMIKNTPPVVTTVYQDLSQKPIENVPVQQLAQPIEQPQISSPENTPQKKSDEWWIF